MKWYQGNIAEAVSVSRKNNSIFVVYIEGDDEKSKKFTEIIDTTEVSQLLESNNFVSIKVESNSLSHQQFTEIYKQTNTPSVFFIGKSGTPLEILTEIKDSQQVIDLLAQVVIRNGGTPIQIKTEDLLKSETKDTNKNLQVQEEPNANKVEEVVNNVVKTDIVDNKVAVEAVDNKVTSAAVDNNVVAGAVDNKVAPASVDNNVAGGSVDKKPEVREVKTEESSGKTITTEEKLKIVHDLIEKKREEKKAEEEEKERLKEIERRKLGQEILKMKRDQQDQEIKQMMEEREREKREEREAREKVRRQIEEDKREKAAKNASVSPSVIEQPKPAPRPVNSNTARLQFKLSDGSAHMHDFPSSVCLVEVIDYLKTSLKINYNFVLSTTFPRREFNANDLSQTLMDLQLVPTAVVLVLPVAQSIVPSSNQGLMGMLWNLAMPIINLLGYIKGIIFGSYSKTDSTNGKRSNEEAEASSSSNQIPKKRAGESVIKRQGNIHRLSDRDSDDENNTWNGNSTQQM